MMKKLNALSITLLLSAALVSLLSFNRVYPQATTIEVTEAEPNDSVDAAQNLGVMHPGTTVLITGRAASDDPGATVAEVVQDCQKEAPFQDYYQFTLSQAMNVSLSLQSDQATDLDLWLFYKKDHLEENDHVIKLVTGATITESEQEKTITPRALEPGTYFVAVNAPASPRIPPSVYALTLGFGTSATELHQLEDFFCYYELDHDPGIYVNVYTPTQYPALLESATFEFFEGFHTPSSVGQQARLIGFLDPQGEETPPAHPTLLFDRREMIARVGDSADGRVVLTFDPPISVVAGKVYLGYEVPEDYQRTGIILSVGKNIFGRRTYASFDDGATFELVSIHPHHGRSEEPPPHVAIIRPVFRFDR
jgi:hypothetical protein